LISFGWVTWDRGNDSYVVKFPTEAPLFSPGPPTLPTEELPVEENDTEPLTKLTTSMKVNAVEALRLNRFAEVIDICKALQIIMSSK
jgi:hypothetical protein